jgi:hypothetical protein
MHKMFAKVWLIAMIFSGLVTAFAIHDTGSDWWTYGEAMLFVGVTTWGVWFVVVALMPWITKD